MSPPISTKIPNPKLSPGPAPASASAPTKKPESPAAPPAPAAAAATAARKHQHHCHHHHHHSHNSNSAPSSYKQKQDMMSEVNKVASSVRDGGQQGLGAKYDDWNGLPGQEHVIKLTDQNLASFIKTNEMVLIVFYAPWCGHCRAIKPEFSLAAQKLARDSPKSLMAAIDCVQFPKVMERYRIQGYPTLKYYHWGNYVGEYKRGRKASEMISFMMRKPSTKDEL